MSTNAVTKQRIPELDYLKGIAIVLMVVGHTIGKTAHPIAFNFIYSFHMPIFFMVSGYCFSEKKFLQLLRVNYKRLIVSYLFTAAVMVIIDVCSEVIKKTITKEIFINELISVFYGIGSKGITVNSLCGGR